MPLSPVMRTQASRGATRAMRLKTACIAGLRPTISWFERLGSVPAVALARHARCSARATASSAWLRSNGLAR